jgi:alkylated DNA repair dioxygenase AlkB
MQPHPWTETLLEIKSRVEEQVCVSFNSVLLNLYRTGQDSVSWHSDNEAELSQCPVIASLSLGATRRFSLKHKWRNDLKPIHLELQSGTLLLMGGTTQRNWLHQVPKTTKPVGQRINLTFRVIG